MTQFDCACRFGSNDNGQLGLGDTASRAVPTRVPHAMRGLCQLAAGDFHSAARTAAGALYTWGSAQYGQLGLAEVGGADVRVPQLVGDLDPALATKQGATERHPAPRGTAIVE